MTNETPRINREALHAWIESRCNLIESTPVPADMLDEVLGDDDSAGMSGNDILALWVGAGLASQVGMSLALDPSQWLTHWPANADR